MATALFLTLPGKITPLAKIHHGIFPVFRHPSGVIVTMCNPRDLVSTPLNHVGFLWDTQVEGSYVM